MKLHTTFGNLLLVSFLLSTACSRSVDGHTDATRFAEVEGLIKTSLEALVLHKEAVSDLLDPTVTRRGVTLSLVKLWMKAVSLSLSLEGLEQKKEVEAYQKRLFTIWFSTPPGAPRSKQTILIELVELDKEHPIMETMTKEIRLINQQLAEGEGIERFLPEPWLQDFIVPLGVSQIIADYVYGNPLPILEEIAQWRKNVASLLPTRPSILSTVPPLANGVLNSPQRSYNTLSALFLRWHHRLGKAVKTTTLGKGLLCYLLPCLSLLVVVLRIGKRRASTLTNRKRKSSYRSAKARQRKKLQILL